MLLEKVAAFITRPGASGPELLLFRHPTAGIQIPSGTVEEGETPQEAGLREAREETGLEDLHWIAAIGFQESVLPDPQRVVCQTSRVYSRPALTSFQWTEFPRGIEIQFLRSEGEYAQVSYTEWDQLDHPQFISYQITGWVLQSTLGNRIRRHFIHLTAQDLRHEHWNQLSDHHLFECFWAPLNRLPRIVSPQSEWLPYVREQLGYQFLE
jgi:8-oxo-dGTP pyrophosphatase MutT (NUDIX family)